MDYSLQISEGTKDVVLKDLTSYAELGAVKAQSPMANDYNDTLWEAYIRSIKTSLHLRQAITDRDQGRAYADTE